MTLLCEMIKWHSFIPEDAEFHIDINGSSSACFSDCKQYRPILERRIADLDDAILWIGMNPSTADAYKNDPTVKREIDFSHRWGYGRYIKANVCDYRSTLPRGMLEAPGGARSALNLMLIRMIAQHDAQAIVLCHGVLPKPLRALAVETVAALTQDGHRLQCLGVTKQGMPRHPLYLKADTALQDFT